MLAIFLLKKLIADFVASAQRADRIGIDGIELHGAHGYLLHQFYRQLPISVLMNMAGQVQVFISTPPSLM
uniref:NADH:flavin oxidoreductase Old Yellow Enzyme family-like protein n=1 Tax=Polynucleobacter necessarius subsp. necessarius (strain STIR1) TaxID=452638 RepID=B1XUL4_POLNS